MKLLQGPKNGHFLNGFVNGFCPKIKLSFIGVFYLNSVTKDRFSILWKENNDF